jgi:hypothetical protein
MPPPLFPTTQTLSFPLCPTLTYLTRMRVERDPTKIQIHGRSCSHGHTSLGRASSHFWGPAEFSQALFFALDYGDGPDDHQGSSS